VLHTRASALRHSSRAMRGSRNFIVALASAAMLAALAACGSDNSTEPHTLATITVTPATATVAAGATQQFTAVGKDAGGNVVSFTPSWSIAAGGGTIDDNGLFTAGSTGGTFNNTVTVSSGSISGTATVVVATSSAPIATIVITPSPATIASGATQQFTAVGKDADGNVVAFTPTWTSLSEAGSINNVGLFTASTTVAGSFPNTVSVTNGTITTKANVTVSPPANLVADFALLTVDGQAPPDTVVHTGTVTIAFLDGTLSLHQDLTYRLLFHSETTTNGGVPVSDSSGSTGTFSLDGTRLVIRNGTSGDSIIATTALPQISFTDGIPGQLFVFSK
jgi:hypothetical protein